MTAETVAEDVLAGLPPMLTVVEAARVLRIGRTLAYKLATDYLDGADGLPVVRLGGCLRVPRESLRPLLAPNGAEIPSAAPVATPARERAARRAPATRPVVEEQIALTLTFDR